MTSRSSNPFLIPPAIDIHIEAWDRDLTIAATEEILELIAELAREAPGYCLSDRGDNRRNLRLPAVQDPVAVANSLKDWADRNDWRCVLDIKGGAEKKSAELGQLAYRFELQQELNQLSNQGINP